MTRAGRFLDQPWVDRWWYAAWWAAALAFALDLLAAWATGAWSGLPLVGVTPGYWASVLIMGAIVFPVAAFYFTRAYWNKLRSDEAASWPVAKGEVLSSEIEDRIVGGGLPHHRVKVRYRYPVEGIAYDGDTVSFGMRGFLMRSTAATIARPALPSMSATTPHWPEDSVLEPTHAGARQLAHLGVAVFATPFVLAAVVKFMAAIR